MSGDLEGTDRDETSIKELFKKIIESEGKRSILVAELDGKIVGMCHISTLLTLNYGGGFRLLVEVVRVDENHKGKGIGTEILEKTKSLGKEYGVNIVVLPVNDNREGMENFYEKADFTEAGYAVASYKIEQ